MDWLSSTLKIYEPYEAPQRYYYWALLSAVSAIVKDKIYFNRKIYNLYCNSYCLLYGPSAVKKGPPIALAKRLVSLVDNTRVINGRATVEGMMKELATVKTKPNKEIINDNCGFVVSSELSSSIVANNSSLDVMTDLFDRIYNEGEWNYILKNEGGLKFKNPTITWLSGSNEALFKDFVPEKNLKGGLIGRMFIIAEKQPNCLNSLMLRDEEEKLPAVQEIANGLNHLKSLKGEFKASDKVRADFNQWYIKFHKEIAPKIHDETGTVGRIDDSILKLAMLISTARRADLEIKEEDIIEAMREVLPLIMPTKKMASAAKGDPAMNEKKEAVLRAIIEARRIKRVDLLRRFLLKLDHEDLNRVIDGLIQAEMIKQDRLGNDIWYEVNLSNEEIREYVKQFER